MVYHYKIRVSMCDTPLASPSFKSRFRKCYRWALTRLGGILVLNCAVWSAFEFEKGEARGVD